MNHILSTIMMFAINPKCIIIKALTSSCFIIFPLYRDKQPKRKGGIDMFDFL